ncbi:MAG: Uma2 family endonuclease, partial [Limisphaerales bacterium]
MAMLAETSRSFEPGSTGWAAHDLDDPRIERLWEEGRYEIIEGVLTQMPAARYDGQKRLQRLAEAVNDCLRSQGRAERLVLEVDLVLGDLRVVRADALLLTPADEQRQRDENKRAGHDEGDFGRIIVPPTLLIESVSLGHERHDQILKRGWYADARIPNYWIFEPYRC